MYSPFCLHNCLFLFTAYFAKNSASKFCQGLLSTVLLACVHDVIILPTWDIGSRYCEFSLKVYVALKDDMDNYVAMRDTARCFW